MNLSQRVLDFPMEAGSTIADERQKNHYSPTRRLRVARIWFAQKTGGPVGSSGMFSMGTGFFTSASVARAGLLSSPLTCVGHDASALSFLSPSYPVPSRLLPPTSPP